MSILIPASFLQGCFRALAPILLLTIIHTARAADPLPTSRREIQQQTAAAFDERRFADAQRLIEAHLARNPKDAFSTYNLACALAMQGEADAAAEKLLDAVSLGLSDMFHVEHDPHLAPIRDHPQFRRLMAGWRAILDARAESDAAAAREALGRAYTSERDPALRLSYISATRPESFSDAKTQIALVAAWAEKELGITPSPDESRPDPWVLIVIPTPADFLRLIGQDGIGGYYDQGRKRLITQDIGPSLRHEFFHVLHWRDMDRLHQMHPFWIMEGLACVLEDVEVDETGALRIAPSWRTNIAKRLEKSSRLTPWSRLFSMQREAFMGGAARANYAQARAVFMFMLDNGKLRDWYRAYIADFTSDPAGLAAIETAFSAGIPDVEKQFRQWLRALPVVGEIGKPGAASLGVDLGPGEGDGPVVEGIVAMSAAKAVGEEKLRRRDIILAVDGQTTRTLDDIFRILGEHEPGDIVTLGIRRASRRMEVRLQLVSPEAPPVPP